MKNKKLYALAISLACGLAVVFLFKLKVLDSLELKTLDFRFRHLEHAVKADTNIVMVAIDEKSLRAFKDHNIVWKWPRDLYAALVRYFHRGGAKVVVFDILFSDPDIDRVASDGAETDSAFARAIRGAGNVVLAAQLQDDKSLFGEDNELVFRQKLAVDFTSPGYSFAQYSNAILPEELFQESTAALGAANYYTDPFDDVCRRLPLMLRYGNTYFPQLGVAAYVAAQRVDTITILDRKVRMRGVDIPIDQDGNFLIMWYGKGGPDGCFSYYSIGPLITSARDEEQGKSPFVPSGTFKDKVIFVGASAAGLFDLKTTPFTRYEPYPGMEISATILSNLLHRDFLVRAGDIWAIMAILMFAFTTSFSFVFIPRVRTVMIIVASSIIAWLAVCFAAFAWNDVWVPLAAPLSSVVLSMAASAIISYQTERKARRRLKSIFGRYVSPSVVSEILSKDEDPGLGGKELHGTVLFTDIKDFTTISERMSPRDLVALLNDYFSIATDVIQRHEGMLDKYLGDAIMALFGAPLTSEGHAVQACLSALQIQELVAHDNILNMEGRPKLITRIGLNSGPMVVGNVGSDRRLDFTAIGDTVNLASRLEGANKIYGTRIIVSERTLKESQDRFIVRPLDILRVKGKTEPVAIFELIAEREKGLERDLVLAQRFRQGCGWYRERSFKKALSVFQEILTQSPEDGPSQLYRDRCIECLSSPPPEDWDGVFTLYTK